MKARFAEGRPINGGTLILGSDGRRVGILYGRGTNPRRAEDLAAILSVREGEPAGPATTVDDLDGLVDRLARCLVEIVDRPSMTVRNVDGGAIVIELRVGAWPEGSHEEAGL